MIFKKLPEPHETQEKLHAPLKKHSFVCFFPNYQELTANQNYKKGILFIVYYIGPYYIILCIICRKKKIKFSICVNLQYHRIV